MPSVAEGTAHGRRSVERPPERIPHAHVFADGEPRRGEDEKAPDDRPEHEEPLDEAVQLSTADRP
jgi:hypothetical protein